MKSKHSILVVIALLISVGFLFAQEEAAAAAPASSEGVNLIEVFSTSGAFAYLILANLLIGLALALVRYIQLFVREKIDAEKFFFKLKNFVKNDQIDEATKIADQFKTTTMGFIFWSGLTVYKDVRKSGKKGEEGRIAVQNAFDEAVLQTVHKLDGGLFWFDTLAQISTYLGLLGTIFGLIAAFGALGKLTGAAQQKALTDGIYVAIGTTALGLMGAIPLTLIKGGLYTRATTLISNIDEYSVKLVNHINNYIKE
ncbi:MAG: MotA/TolQ/ExbB proton channel family protein [Candidatus Cloacimonetes bacterium]|jgi:biopolymer transport protein ExbB/TolQ|nr:MotA/TolQ/ExbB proton channel family protein [Candidatus Cloacimonadota bacterium]MCB5286942.1 MotA/TolQ/ExbB proton channel family protein [Candidatus Cloacimonadota bacterium]MCK9184601.1 MotA/TolQ/ExbB proton channel family protein [Candidatus Cloacimonadota bacterium]MCK9584818.1 MotA/TolQ/ExbB proton channel family protein [Candidatus Cloacimonadota bacterium]MDY0229263.1 MotA/TolQ/ExbB proton channel family protein [Candidatus Cloacimonadaceae bacterium]